MDEWFIDESPNEGWRTGPGWRLAFYGNGAGKYARFAPASKVQPDASFRISSLLPAATQRRTVQSRGRYDQDSQVALTAADRKHPDSPNQNIGGYRIISVKTLGGEVRLFGAVLENDDPGVGTTVSESTVLCRTVSNSDE